jgi:hypothetical protein
MQSLLVAVVMAQQPCVPHYPIRASWRPGIDDMTQRQRCKEMCNTTIEQMQEQSKT